MNTPDIPDESLCLELLNGVQCSGKVIAHARVVAGVVLEFIDDEAVDGALATCGALLHDIGRSATHSLDHAIAGGDICRELGLPEEIARIVERHLGAGQTAEECLQIGLLPRDCMPVSLPEKIVAHADNLVKGTSVIHIEERMMKIIDLPGKKRRRTYRLALEMELFRR
ncbi:MAG: Uncharacterized protein XE11_1340 [Methanomicrobiales archaeon 53_19]|uniref:HDIG domain-containing metalloprotein n=1 Tax=Methanocalculus sp. TaxID=2004547 RepID=UPI0007476B42|nr:HDIG domain-containing metalloprotein [Methanocalculus sp.]KUK68091.1 MAG: Uncharacterized protein XD88_2041 [Methanocalculus sp. 52_23]KUL03248.1 MAG: Uncharacterized protein XE11_1340 [Methanomicrobiales archaeon 53_19]HIJ07253.1 HDIG domain-containing protein [Methanocalculus sp.]